MILLAWNASKAISLQWKALLKCRRTRVQSSWCERRGVASGTRGPCRETRKDCGRALGSEQTRRDSGRAGGLRAAANVGGGGPGQGIQRVEGGLVGPLLHPPLTALFGQQQASLLFPQNQNPFQNPHFPSARRRLPCRCSPPAGRDTHSGRDVVLCTAVPSIRWKYIFSAAKPIMWNTLFVCSPTFSQEGK